MADSIKDFWQLISGKAVLLPDEIISAELNANKNKLSLCLNYFKSLSGTPKVENIGKKLPQLHSNFVLKLSQFLNLEEKQCYNIYQQYLLRFPAKNTNEIQEALSLERCTSLLVEKIRDFYQSERIYLLRCVKHILSYSDDPDHPHYEIFKEFVGNLLEGDGFINEIKKQYMNTCDKINCLFSLNQQELRGLMCPMSVAESARQSGIQVCSLQRERCELLEIIILSFKHLQLSSDVLIQFFNIFKKHGFAGSVVGQKNVSDGTDQSLLTRIGFLQTLVLVGGFDLELLVEKYSEPTIEGNLPELMLENNYKQFNEIINSLTDQQCLSPLFLAWTVVRHLRKDQTFVKLGNKSLKLEVFKYLHDVLNDMNKNNVEQSVISLAHNILYGLLNSVLSIFHESTLGDTTYLVKILNQCLENPLIADAFWSLGLDEGVRSLLTSSLEMFPIQFERPMEMLISLARAGVNSLQQVMNLLQNLTIFTDVLDRQTYLSPASGEVLYKLDHSRKSSLYPGSRIVISANTFGKMFTNPVVDGSTMRGEFMSWLMPCDGFEILIGEISNLLSNFESFSSMGGQMGREVERVVMVMRFIAEALRTSPSLVGDSLVNNQLGGFVDGATRLLQSFSTISNPPIQLIGFCITFLHQAMEIVPQEVWRRIQMSGFLPHFSHYVKDINEATRALNSGSYGQILMSKETVEGSYPVTEAFLELILLCVNHPSVKDSTTELTSSVLLICQEIFPTFNRWRYSPGHSSERIGLLCMRIFQKILCREDKDKNEQSLSATVSMPTKTTEHSTTEKLSPEVVVIQSMLFSEAGNILVGIAHTGNEEIEDKLTEQNSAFTGRGWNLIEMVKCSLVLLNQLITKEPSMSSKSTIITRNLSNTPAWSIFHPPSSSSSLPDISGKQGHVPHLIKSVVMYIEHRHDSGLTLQATLLLKNIAQTFPISMLSCLGSDVYKVKEAYLYRLQALTDDIDLKVAILDWLTACIQSQPGLVEIFINDNDDKSQGTNNEPIADLFSDVKTPKKQDVAMKSKCLDTVAMLIREEKQGTYECPMELLCASFELIHSLWKEYQVASMSYLKKLKTFWNSLFCVLDEKNLKKSQNSGNEIQMKCITHVIRIFALEIFHSDRNGNECPEFTEKMNSVIKGDGLLGWSEFIQRILTNTSEDCSRANNESLLLTWRDLLGVLASLKKKSPANRNIGIVEIQHKKDVILLDLLKIIKITLSSPMSVNLKISNILSSTVLIVVNRWNSTLEDPRKLVQFTCDTLESIQRSPNIDKYNNILLSLISSLVIIFKQCKNHLLPDSRNTDLIKGLMDVICRILQSSVLYRDGHEFFSDDEGKKRMKMFEASEKLKLLPIAAIRLLTEILTIFPLSFSSRKSSTGSSFTFTTSSSSPLGANLSPSPLGANLSPSPLGANLPPSPPELVRVSPPSTTFIFDILGRYSIVQCLVSWCTYSLMSRKDLDLVQAIFEYFTKLSQTEKGAEMLFVSGINDHLAMNIHQLYFTGNRQQNIMTAQQNQEKEEQISTYLHFTQLTCQMLITLKAFYLDKAMEYLAIHKERFHSVLETFVLLLFTGVRDGASKQKDDKGSENPDASSKSPINRSAKRSEEANKFSANVGVYELEIVCQFINELARYSREWKSRAPELMQTIMTRLCVWTQKSAGLLLLPRYMQSIIERQRSDHSSGETSDSGTSKNIFSSEDSNTNPLELVQIQQKILSIIATNMNTMKRFSPSLVDVIYQQLDDLPICESFILVDFSNPSIDEVSMPTYGMLISVLNICIDLLCKVEGSRSLSPHKPTTPKITFPASSINKALIMFTMDQVLYVMMSHASYCLKNPKVLQSEKQILKSYLNNELSSSLTAIHRHFRTSSPSPVSARRSSNVGTPTPLKFSREHQFFSIADIFTKQILK